MDYFMHISALSVCMFVHHICASWSEEAIRSPELDLQLLTVMCVLGAKQCLLQEQLFLNIESFNQLLTDRLFFW